MFDVHEGLLDNDHAHHTERYRELLIQEMMLKQQEALITDTFSLIALVIRDRVGRFQQPVDKLWDEFLRKKDLQLFIFSMFGIACTTLIGWLLWYDPTVGRSGERIDVTTTMLYDTNRNRFTVVLFLQIALSTSSFASCVLLCQKYQLHVNEKRRIWSGLDMKQLMASQLSEATEDTKAGVVSKFMVAYNFWQSNLRFKLGAELLIHLLHPNILVNETNTQFIFRAMEFFVFVRLYMLAKLVFVFSTQYTLREEILSSNVELRRTGSPITMTSTLKMLYFAYPSLLTFVIMAIILFVSGFIVFLAERHTQTNTNKFGDLQNAYWFTFVTFATIGYGDLVPKSDFARLVSVFIGASGITVVTVFNGIITNLMVQSRQQRFIVEYLQLIGSSKNCQSAAASVIQSAWRFYQLNQGQIISPWRVEGHRTNILLKHVKRFKAARWMITQSLSTANDPVIDTKMNDVRDDLERCCMTLEKRERVITSSVDSVFQITEDILQLLHGQKQK